jgi:phage protein U
MKIPTKIPAPIKSIGLPFDGWRARVDAAKYQAERLQRIAKGLFPDPPAVPGLDSPTVAGPRTLMSWGLFVFGNETMAYDNYQRRRGWRHASSERFGARPATQYCGPGDDDVTLYGSLIPEIAGSFGAIDRLAEMGDTGDPQPLVDGAGRQWGQYLLVNLDETGTNIIVGGIPRRIDFAIDLKRAAD